MLSKEQIKDLVKRYALACNALLELEKSDLMDLYLQICTLYLADLGNIVIAVTQELVSSDELPEPVRSYWGEFLD